MKRYKNKKQDGKPIDFHPVCLDYAIKSNKV